MGKGKAGFGGLMGLRVAVPTLGITTPPVVQSSSLAAIIRVRVGWTTLACFPVRRLIGRNNRSGIHHENENARCWTMLDDAG